jgi:hypothetical protein
VGPDLTLPSNRQPPPAGRNQRARRPDRDADHDLVLGAAADQPPTTRPDHDRAAEVEHQQAAVRLHRELTDTDAGALCRRGQRRTPSRLAGACRCR